MFPLFLRFTERELSSRFAGSSLGVAWALVGPLLLLAIYSFVFGQILRPRLSDLGTESYTLFVAIALWPWMMFADGIARGMNAVQTNGALVKKVAFPHLLLVGSAVSAAFVLHLVGYVGVLAVLALFGSPIAWAGVPVALYYLCVLFGFTLGLAAFFAALQTLMRDTEQAVNPAVMMLHYLTPVLYPITLIPLAYRGWLDWNPLATIVTRIREALLLGSGFQVGDLMPLVWMVVALALGLWLFRRLSPYFEDFL